MLKSFLLNLNLWFAASRPVTLIAAIIPVMLGYKVAYDSGFTTSIFLLIATLSSAMAIQVATNFFNDLVDFQRGSDSRQRKGPKRLVAAGQLSPKAMFRAGLITLLLACFFALPLLWNRGLIILLIGLPALYLSYGYTAKPLELAYRGLGEIFVLLYFGLIAVVGSAFVQTGEILLGAIFLGIQAGALACTLIAINNLRDREEDRLANKKTLAVRFGKKFAQAEICLFLLVPFIWQAFSFTAHSKIFMILAALMAVINCILVLDSKERFLRPLLPSVACCYLIFGLAFFY